MGSDKSHILQIGIVLTLVIDVQAKTCQTLHLTNAHYNPGTNGYYDLIHGECTDREVYEQRKESQDNDTIQYYLYYENPDDLNYGWTVGREPCSLTGYVFNWNNNKRPDYTLRYWLEREGTVWLYSFDLRVKCTEGLTFGALIGVIIGCICAVPLIGVFIYLMVRKIKSKKRNRTSNSNTARTPNGEMPRGDTTMSSGEYGVPNYAFNNNDGSMYPVAFDMPAPYHMMAPPTYEETATGNTSSNPADDVNGTESKPPTYEDVLAEMGEVQAIIITNTPADDNAPVVANEQANGNAELVRNAHNAGNTLVTGSTPVVANTHISDSTQSPDHTDEHIYEHIP